MTSKVLLAAIVALLATNTVATARTAKQQPRPAAQEQMFDIHSIHEQLRLTGS